MAQGGQARPAASGDMAHVDTQVIREKALLLTPGPGPQWDPAHTCRLGEQAAGGRGPASCISNAPKGLTVLLGFTIKAFTFKQY